MAKEKIQRDMFDYIGDGNTLYDIVGRMSGDTDFSTLGMITKALRIAHNSGDASVHFAKETYDYAFSRLTSGLDSYFSREEQIRIMTDIHGAVPKKFSTLSINEVVKYLNDNKEKYNNSLASGNDISRNKAFEAEYETISEKVFGAVISKCEEDIKEGRDTDGQIAAYLLDIRSKIFKGAYFPRINNEIKRRYPNRGTVPSEEAEVATFAAATLFETSKMAEYDEYLREYNEKVRTFKEKAALTTRLTKRRIKVIESEIVLGMKPDQYVKAKKDGYESVVFKGKRRRAKEARPGKEGTFKWSVRESAEPKVILDVNAEYSQNGEENQRVVAVSYGKFMYDTMFNKDGKPTISSEALDLVGVTRLGRDGVKTYFVVVPFRDIKFKPDRYFNPEVDGPNERKIFANGVEVPIVDSFAASKLDEYKREGMRPLNTTYQAAIQGGRLRMLVSDKIPENKVDFYSKVAFSDAILSQAVDSNYRFAGIVMDTDYGTGVTLDASYTFNPYDIEALMYASAYSGKIGRREYINFEEYCKSSELMAKHLGIVRDVTKGAYDYLKVVDDEVR